MVKFYPTKGKKDETRINKMIRVPEVRLIDAAGNQAGIVPTPEALKAAEDAGIDLVEVSPTAKPPVCRIMDYGKYKYQMSKKAHEAKKKQAVIHMKEIKLRTKTGVHDLEFKVRNIRRFLSNGDKVKVGIFFRGREITHTEFGVVMLKKVAEEVKDIGAIEQQPRLEGRNMFMLIGPMHAK